MKKFISFVLAITMLMVFNVTCFAADKGITEAQHPMSARSSQLFYDSGVTTSGYYEKDFYVSQSGNATLIYAAGATSNKVYITFSNLDLDATYYYKGNVGDQTVYTKHLYLPAGRYRITMETGMIDTFSYVINLYR